ncbi:MAG: hypothetical protein ACOYL8_04980 [Patescibacteria group bacterium]
MTLKEKAFMIDLIKRNYRRRMKYFFIELAIIIVGLIFFATVASRRVEGLGAIEGFGAIVLIVIGVVFMVFANRPFGYDMASPWKIKKIQTETLNQYSKLDFEELERSVPLHEYFYV